MSIISPHSSINWQLLNHTSSQYQKNNRESTLSTMVKNKLQKTNMDGFTKGGFQGRNRKAVIRCFYLYTPQLISLAKILANPMVPKLINQEKLFFCTNLMKGTSEGVRWVKNQTYITSIIFIQLTCKRQDDAKTSQFTFVYANKNIFINFSENMCVCEREREKERCQKTKKKKKKQSRNEEILF